MVQKLSTPANIGIKLLLEIHLLLTDNKLDPNYACISKEFGKIKINKIDENTYLKQVILIIM